MWNIEVSLDVSSKTVYLVFRHESERANGLGTLPRQSAKKKPFGGANGWQKESESSAAQRSGSIIYQIMYTKSPVSRRGFFVQFFIKYYCQTCYSDLEVQAAS